MASGNYSSASEVVRCALRLLELEEKKLKESRNALIDGENNPIIGDFDANSLKKIKNKEAMWFGRWII